MSEKKDSEQPQSGSSRANEATEKEAGKASKAAAKAAKLVKPEVAEKVKGKVGKAKEARQGGEARWATPASTTTQVVAAVQQQASGPFVEEAKRKAGEATAAANDVLMRSPDLKEFTQDIVLGGATDAVSIAEVAQEAGQAVPQTSSKKERHAR